MGYVLLGFVPYYFITPSQAYGFQSDCLDSKKGMFVKFAKGAAAISSNAIITSSQTMRTLIIDTDVGFDDLVAIQCLLHHRKSCLITTVGGVLPATTGAATLKGIFPKASIVTGRNSPVMPFDPIPAWLVQYRSHVLKGFSEALKINPTPTMPEDPTAPHDNQHQAFAHVSEILNRSDRNNSVDIICLGPLTNLADWIRLHEEDGEQEVEKMISRINKVFILGGNHPESILFSTEAPEFNFSLDPAAVEKVFGSVLANKIYLVPTTVTDLTRIKSSLGESHLDAFLEERRDSKHFISKVLHYDTGGYSLSCDPVCAFALEHPKCVQWEVVPVQVDASSGLLLAKNDEHPARSVVQIATEIDLKGYLDWVGSSME